LSFPEAKAFYPYHVPKMNLRTIAFIGLSAISLIAPAKSEIQAGTTVKIEIMGVPGEEKIKIDSMYPVAEGGKINMPFVGKIQAAGLTSEALSDLIEASYIKAGIYENPTIQVFADRGFDGPQEQFVHVGGQVRKTGRVNFQKGLTLYQAVQAAGGTTEFGSMKRVQLLRDGKTQSFDLTKPEFMTFPVKPSDTLIVPQKTIFNG